MSQFIFDQIYGSQAKKKKIMENTNFLYYRQMMKIKNKHIANPSLYAQLYHLPTYQQPTKTLNKSQHFNTPDIFSTLNQNNYVIQKINPHAFKIVKRKQKCISTKNKDNNFFNMTIHLGNSLSTGRKLVSRTIDGDAQQIRSYLASSQEKTSGRSKSHNKNQSMELQTNRTFRTTSKIRNSQYQTSAFSRFHESSAFDFKKN